MMEWRTEAGSIVNISGKHNGIYNYDFDWFEEGACINAVFGLEVDVSDPSDAWLRWNCECCEPNQTRLIPLPTPPKDTP